jgi:dynein light intermediate chain 2
VALQFDGCNARVFVGAEEVKKEGAAGEVAEGEATPTVQKATPNGREAFVLFVGDKEGGKSSLVTQFLNPNKLERPKPTVALEYTFGRRSNPANSQKDIAHIWELAGGMSASQLIRVPLTPDRLATAVVCITVNLEKPGNVIATTLKWINLITQQVNSCLEDVRKKNPALAATIQENAKKRNKNGDAELLCPVPLLIFASKYDVFAHEDGVKRKALMCALRHVAHVHGASLLCTSTGDKSVMNQFRNLLNHYVFCTDLKVKVGTEPGAPLVIPSGADTTESIGFPKSARSQADFDSQPVPRYTLYYSLSDYRLLDFRSPASSRSGKIRSVNSSGLSRTSCRAPPRRTALRPSLSLL